jgi:hypothetical protein
MADETIIETPPATDAPWHSAIFTPEGGFIDQWQTKLPAEYEDHRATLANYKDLGGLATALKENMTAARAKPAGLIVPPADAPAEVRSAYQLELRKLNGVPDSVDGYKLEKPATLPTGVEWSDDLAKGFAAKAHEWGLTPAQAEKALAFDMERLDAASKLQEKQHEELLAHERTEMTKRFGDKVDTVLMQASRLAATLNLPNAKELFDPRHPLFAGVDMAAAFAQLAGQVGEKSLVSGAAVNNMDPETMANDIMGNPNNPEHAAWKDSAHPQSAAVRAKVNDLFKRASAAAGKA